MELLRHVLPHMAAGCLAGVMAAAAIVASNLGSLRDLMLQTDGGWIAYGLLTMGFAWVFGSAAAGHAVIALGSEED